MNIRLIKFRKQDYGRFLKLKFGKKTAKDLEWSLFSYALEGVKSLINRKRIFKFAILDDKTFIGFASIMNIRNFYELKIFIIPQYRNKGVAATVAKKLTDHAFTKIGLKAIVAICDEDKEGAKRTLKKLGFKLVKRNAREKTLVWEKKRK